MGPVLVPAMAQGRVGETSSEKLHPFFSGAHARSETCSAATACDALAESPVQDSSDDGRREKRRKAERSPARPGPETKKSRQRKADNLDGPLTGAGILGHLVRTNPSPLNKPPIIATPPDADDAPTLLGDMRATPAAVAATATGKTRDGGRQTPKVLKFNPKTGTLGSPPKPKHRKGPALVVCMRYGHDDETRKTIGTKVTQILNGELQIPITPTKQDGRDSGIASSAKQPGEASLHPYFVGKPKPPPPPSEQTRPGIPARNLGEPKCSVFMSTPVSPRKSRSPLAQNSLNKALQFGIKGRGNKIPGAMLPMWPAAGMSHVRGGDRCSGNSPSLSSQDELTRKSKGHVTTITPSESLLTCLVDHMHMDLVRKSLPRDEDSFEPAPPELRLPRTRFESGRQLQQHVRSQLSTPSALAAIDECNQDELPVAPSPPAHPAISCHYNSLTTSLSAFDKSSCESLSWTQKYAPATAAQVLQTGKQMSLFKQWLEALKVQSVESGGDGGGDKKAKPEPTSKRKKRKTKLEGFVVDSDDEASELDELSDSGDDADTGLIKRSVIRALNASSRSSRAAGKLRNTVVISGPHGCGKTASVYAVAKELGFEIFELNPGSRRSGKDIVEKVGNMTQNHLVQQHQSQATAADGEPDGAADDSRSVKQGTMTSFFSPKPTAQAKKKAKEKAEKSNTGPAPKSQKQSLILLEEADVLYDEDKQFWTTLMTMMVQSKRPFVVTCNDENLVPIQSLCLHAIFRFSAPPPSLAVDLCLLMAANEGHALERAAVESLYRSRGDDLRATITELNYWCQMGVGDRKGGLDWFYPRYPKGSDLHDNGDVVRVISQGTYLHGMGWIGRDLLTSTPEPLALEEETLRQAWNSWQVDMSDWCEARDVSSPLVDGGVEALAAYQDFCAVMSDADICSRSAFGSKLEEQMDPTLPELAAGARDDFIIGHQLLHADTAALSTPASATAAITMKSSARQMLVGAAAAWRRPGAGGGLAPMDESKAVAALDSSFRLHRFQMTRHDISAAFDPIAASAKAPTALHLDPSVFDRPMKPIVLDVAPWVRGIMAFEDRLRQERLKLSSLLGQGGSEATAGKKRMRTTRSAYSALEGGERRTTRRERYFGNCLVTDVVMRTGPVSLRDATKAESSQDHVPGLGQSPSSPRAARSESPG